MAIKITRILPTNLGSIQDRVLAHAAIISFDWVNESTQEVGSTPREAMYNWIVNQGGSAYINLTGENIFLFGASTPTGVHYIRAARNGAWTDDLLTLSGV